MTSRKENITQILTQAFSPQHLTVLDESDQHNVPKHAQSHFKIIMVSEDFANTSRINRHRMVNACLQKEFSMGMHALSLLLYAPDEWDPSKVTPSPVCKGGMKREK